MFFGTVKLPEWTVQEESKEEKMSGRGLTTHRFITGSIDDPIICWNPEARQVESNVKLWMYRTYIHRLNKSINAGR